MSRTVRSPLVAALVVLVAGAGCVAPHLAAYAPCEGQMGERVAKLPSDSVTPAMRDSASSEARACAIQRAMATAQLNEQLRALQQQQVDDALRLERLTRELQTAAAAATPQP